MSIDFRFLPYPCQYADHMRDARGNDPYTGQCTSDKSSLEEVSISEIAQAWNDVRVLVEPFIDPRSNLT